MSKHQNEFTPVNQVRLTNVAYIRLQKAGKRFEIACYRNKALNWRSKVETDINEVLQTDSVFSNVSKGMLANVKDIENAFGTSDKKLVCMEILNKGELQVSEQERLALQEVVFKDVANIIVDKTLNPETDRPYTVAIIQNAMRQIQYSVSISKSSKAQALEVIRKLKDIMPIKRTKMLLRIYCYAQDEISVKLKIAKEGASILGAAHSGLPGAPSGDAQPAMQPAASPVPVPTQPQESSKSPQLQVSVDFEIEPDAYRAIEALVKSMAAEGVRMEVLQMRTGNTGATGAGTAVSVPSAHARAAEEDAVKGRAAQGELSGAIRRMSLSDSDDNAATGTGAAAASRPRQAANSKGGSAGQKKEGAGRARLSSGSASDGDDILAHIAVAPSLVKRKEKNQEKKVKKNIMRAKMTSATGTVAATLAKLAEAQADAQAEAEAEVEAAQSESDSSDDDAVSAGIEEKTADPRQASRTDGPLAAGRAKEAAEGKQVAGDKQGKRAKRLEKEAKEERLQKAQALQARIDSEAQQLAQQQQKVNAAAGAVAVAPTGTAGANTVTSTVQRCITCGGAFTDAVQYRQHFRSEWHRYNLNRKLKDLPPLSEQEFIVTEGLA